MSGFIREYDKWWEQEPASSAEQAIRSYYHFINNESLNGIYVVAFVSPQEEELAKLKEWLIDNQLHGAGSTRRGARGSTTKIADFLVVMLRDYNTALELYLRWAIA